jgi:hypothetical protein
MEFLNNFLKGHLCHEVGILSYEVKCMLMSYQNTVLYHNRKATK